MPDAKILIVEDEGITAMELETKLEIWGYPSPVIALSGEEAIEKALKTRPDLILMDISLKGEIDGIEVIEQIKKHFNPPVIYITAHADDKTMERAKLTEHYSYMVKPIGDKELKFAIDMALFKHKVNQKLKESEQQLRLITDNMSDIVGQFDNEGFFQYISPSVKTVLGYEPETLIGRSLFEFLHPDDVKKVNYNFKKASTTSLPRRLETRFRTADGDYIWLETVANPLFDEKNHRNGVIFSSRDITERKRIEEQLSAALIYNRGLIEVSPDPLIIISPDGKITDVNEATEKLTGLGRDDLLGKDFSEYFTDPEKAIEGYRRALSDGFFDNYSLQVFNQSGKATEVLLNGIVFKNETGEIQGVFATARDITELKKSEEKYRTIVENINDVIFTLDIKGNFTYISPTIVRISGYKADEIINQNFSNFVHPDDLSGLQASLERTLSGQKEPYEFRVLDKDGAIVYVRTSSQLFMKDGRIFGLSGVMTDITERQKAISALKKSEEKYKNIFENTSTSTLIIEEDNIISLVNHEFEKLSGYSKEEIEGKRSWTEFVVKDYLERMKEYHRLRRIDPNAAPQSYESQLIDREGNIKNIIITVSIIPGTKKSLVSLLDLTAQKKAEDKLKESLKEKEILLREVYHRVKNNMQIISSLIGLQSEYARDKEVLEMFDDSKNRIRAMALIHEKLYQSENLAQIEFSEYLTSLRKEIIETYEVKTENIHIKINVDNVLLDIDTAIPCGLIINELVSNSLKHAFPDNRKGEIGVTLNFVDKDFKLIVSDDGVGFPEDLDFTNTETLGLRIVNTLVAQLDGDIQLDRSKGTSFEITFK
ncbi:MAG: PAS domain S-box protein [Actinobacteria bacterium]|nr:PAS domain S-box protein [Actinomycetota bacterium]